MKPLPRIPLEIGPNCLKLSPGDQLTTPRGSQLRVVKVSQLSKKEDVIVEDITPRDQTSKAPQHFKFKAFKEEDGNTPRSNHLREVILEDAEDGELEQSSFESAGSFESDELIENLVESLNWFSRHTLWMLKQENASGENDVASDTVRQILIDNVNKRIKRNLTVVTKQATMQREATMAQGINAQYSGPEIQKMDVKSLKQLLGSFMPVIKLDKNSYLLGAEVKQVNINGD